MVNKVEIKNFLGMEVRVVNGTHIVLKDMFSALGRVKDNGDWSDASNKLGEFLSLIDKKDHSESLGVVVKRGQIEEVKCLRLETAPIVLTQFKPTKAKGEEALSKWCNFMKFVNEILTKMEVYKFIVTDKEHQKDNIAILSEDGGNPTVANQKTNTIMAKLMGVYPDIKSIKKEELKIYQNQTTVDLLSVREFVLENFVKMYQITESHKTAGEMVLKLAMKRYDIAS